MVVSFGSLLLKNKMYMGRVVLTGNRMQCRGGCQLVASLVPRNMPFLVDRPESLPQQQPTFDFFDINTMNELMFPDIVSGIDTVYNGALLLSFIVICVSFEVLELLREYNSDREYIELNETMKGREVKKRDTKKNDGLRQRRRGLGWLALVTFVAVWSTGVLNSPSPLQP